MQTLLYIAGAITLTAGALTVLWRALRGMTRMARSVTRFLDDWYGEPERDGVPERLGVMAQIATIRSELHPNHGTSLRDAVDRIETRVSDHIHDTTRHTGGTHETTPG